MADPREQQQGVVLPPGYENEQIVNGNAAQSGQTATPEAQAAPDSSQVQLPEGYEGSQVNAGPKLPPAPPTPSIGPRIVNAIGSMVPEGATAAAQKAEEAVGSVVPQWSLRPMRWIQQHINEPLDKAAQFGSKVGQKVGRNVIPELDKVGAELTGDEGPTLTEAESAKKYPVATGVLETAGGAVGGMATDPRNWPFLGVGSARPIIQKALSGGFGVAMTKDAADAATELSATWDDLNPEQRAQLAARAGLNTILATVAAHHVAGPERVGKVTAGAKRLGGDLMADETGANVGERVSKKNAGVVTGSEQFEPKNLPKAKGAELPAAATRVPYAEPTPAAPEQGLVGSDYSEAVVPKNLPEVGGNIPRIPYAEPTPSAPSPEVATGADQFDIKNLPGVSGAEPVAEPKQTGPKTPYGTIDIESMEPSKTSGFPEVKVEEKPITKGEVKSSPGTSMGEERRSSGDRRAFEQEHEGEERRKSNDRRAPMNATELEAAIRSGKPVQTPFDVTAGAKETIERDKAMPKAPAEEAKAQRENIVKHVEGGKDFAVLQAENPQNTRISPEENSKRTEQLKQDLIQKGYKPVEVGGNTKDVEGVKEHAFFVPDISAEDAAELGRKYGQQGILTHEGLHDLNTDKVNPLDKEKGLLKGDEARKQQYFTTIAGEDYHFPLDMSKESSHLERVGDRYNRSIGAGEIDNEKVGLDPKRNAIADAYDAMKHDPTNPKVKESYDALKQETKDQWDALKKAGYKLEASKEDPYKSYEDMAKDIKDNKRIKVWTGAEPPTDHPMSETDPETGLTYNTLFRAVHDIMGHAAGDNDFSEVGEENAYKRHAQSYSDKAVPALTTETKGQTSTFFNSDRVRKGGTPDFPEQKANLLPKEYYAETEPKAVETNASGESAASQEAINREQSNKAQGVKTYRVDTRSGKATIISGVDAADAKANPNEKIVQVKGDQITEMDSGTGAHPLDEKKLLEQAGKDTEANKEQEAKVKATAAPKRDTNILAQVQKDMPNASLSEQLMEAGRRAQKVEQAAPETEAGGEHYGKVESTVGDLSNNNLRELAKAVGVDPAKYDFSKREALREGGSKHPVERIQLVKDVLTKMKPEDIQKIGEQIAAGEPENVGGKPARSQKARATDAESVLKSLWEKKEETPAASPVKNKHDLGDDEFTLNRTYGDNSVYYNREGDHFTVEDKDGNQYDFDHKEEAQEFAKTHGKFEGKGPAPVATTETAKMSNEELLKKGFTQEDIDAGKNVPKVGGGADGEAKKMAGMENIPEKITKHFLTEEEASLKTPKSQETAAEKLKKMPALQEFIDIANRGAGERRWYQRGTAAVRAIASELPHYFDKDGDQAKFLNVLAALSPRQAITENFTEAIRVWKEFKDMEKDGIDPFETVNKKGTTRLKKMLSENIGINRGSKIPNATKAFSGASALEMWPDLSKNTNFKVPSFAANLNGFLKKVTSDGWMAAFAGMDDMALKNPSSYHPLAVMTRAAAEELGWEPAEAQAAIWAVVKTLTEKGETEAPEIRKYSQDFAEIAQSDTQIRDMLKEMGVDLEKLDGRLKAIEGKPEVSSRSTPTTENSIGKLTKRLEGQGREIPRPKSDQRGLNFEEEGDTSFEPSKYGNKSATPITDSMVKAYGTTDSPKGAAQFITSEGKRIPVQDHDAAVSKAMGKKKIAPEDRVSYINDENSVRMRTRTGKGGKEIVFSVPSGDLSDSQVEAMKESVKALGAYGTAYFEEAEPGGNYSSLVNAKPEDVDAAIKELKKPRYSPMVKAFHVGGEE